MQTQATLNYFGNKHGGTSGKDEWLTPPQILAALGTFDFDPCAPVNRVWDMARHHFTTQDDGLTQEWFGRVWLNPPYGTQTGKWIERLAQHGNGIALTFARTETRMFFSSIWNKADAILFIQGRLRFYNANGTPANNCGGAPSCLIAYGQANVEVISASGIKGRLIKL